MIRFALSRPLTKKEKFITQYLPWVAMIIQIVAIPIEVFVPMSSIIIMILPFALLLFTVSCILFSMWYLRMIMKREQRIRQVIREERRVS